MSQQQQLVNDLVDFVRKDSVRRSRRKRKAYYTIGEPIDRGGFGIIQAVAHESRLGIFARKQLFKSSVRKDKLETEVNLIREAAHHHVVSIVD